MADDAVLRQLGVTTDDLLGFGGEAEVFELPDGTVARVPRTPDRGALLARTRLLESLDAAAVPFLLPEVLDLRDVGDTPVVVERRLPGRDGRVALGEAAPTTAEEIIRAGLDATTAIPRLRESGDRYGALDPTMRVTTGFGDAGGSRFGSFLDWATAAVDRSYRFGNLTGWPDPAALAADLPRPTRPAFTHLDAFLGNMLVDGGRVTAVIDFGPLTAYAGELLDPLLFAAYLDEAITPQATDSHRRHARRWLAEQGLADAYQPARRWAAGFWAGAVDDIALHRWCRSVLLGP